jgi:amino acid transporter
MAPPLKKELGLWDVVFFTLAGTIGTRWLSAAANAGPGSITLWVLAAALFLIPSTFAIAALSRKYPEQGGLYVWTKRDFGDWAGFLCFWLYWISIALWFPSAVMAYSSMAVYALGPAFTHLAHDRTYVVTMSLIMVWLALGSHLIGLRFGKWTQIFGGIGSYALGFVLIVVAFFIFEKRGSATPMRLAPEWNWATINFWSQIAYALTGLELAPMLGSEIRDAGDVLPKSAWISAFSAAGYYAAATAALLIILPPAQVDPLFGLAEGGRTAGAALGLDWLGPMAAIMILMGAIGQFGALGAAASRLPFVVGADRYFPKAFAKLHPVWGTPYWSILLLGAIASFFLILVQAGETLKAAYQLLVDLMVLTTFIPFGFIFLSAWKCGRRISAALGLAVSALAMICSLVPTADVSNVWLFEAKLLGGTILLIGSAWWMFQRAQRSHSSGADAE